MQLKPQDWCVCSMYPCKLNVYGQVALAMNVQMHDQSALRQEVVTAQVNCFKSSGSKDITDYCSRGPCVCAR